MSIRLDKISLTEKRVRNAAGIAAHTGIASFATHAALSDNPGLRIGGDRSSACDRDVYRNLLSKSSVTTVSSIAARSAVRTISAVSGIAAHRLTRGAIAALAAIAAICAIAAKTAILTGAALGGHSEQACESRYVDLGRQRGQP